MVLVGWHLQNSCVTESIVMSGDTAALKRSEAHYRLIFESTRNYLVVIDYPSGRIVNATPSFLAVAGTTLDAIVGTNFWQCPYLAPAEQMACMQEIMQSSHSHTINNLTLHTHTAAYLDVELSCIRFHEDGFERVLCNLYDVTLQRQMERSLERAQQQVIKHLFETIGVLSNVIEARDPYTAGHQSRVADLAVAIATEMGLSDETKTGIHVAAMLHDIGKIAVPSDLLVKSTPLSQPEADLLKSHVEAGYAILQPLTFPWTIDLFVLQHHERLDGSGYPHGLRGDALCLEGRILAVADTVEAMIGERPYRMPLTLDESLESLEKDQGKRYDSTVVSACLKLFREKGYHFPKAKNYVLHSLSERFI